MKIIETVVHAHVTADGENPVLVVNPSPAHSSPGLPIGDAIILLDDGYGGGMSVDTTPAEILENYSHVSVLCFDCIADDVNGNCENSAHDHEAAPELMPHGFTSLPNEQHFGTCEACGTGGDVEMVLVAKE